MLLPWLKELRGVKGVKIVKSYFEVLKKAESRRQKGKYNKNGEGAFLGKF